MKKDIEEVVDEINEEAEKENIKRNSRPCELCGSKKFIQLYRNVVGEISGSMQGYFSLFGGAVSGRIDGYTKTLPVLSCKKCKNEREVETWGYTSGRKWFWNEIRNFYWIIDKNDPDYGKIQEYFLERPLETRQFMLDNKNYDWTFYNVMPSWGTEVWAKAGFKIKPITKKFLFWEWKKYPSWEELTNLNSL